MWIQRRAAALVLLALTTVLVVAQWPVGKAVAETSKKPADDVKLEIPSLKKLRGKKLGMLSGAQFDTMLLNNLRGINQEDFLYFNSNA